MTSLLTLPNELLQNIACYLPCSAILKFIRVNRRLHEACNDRLVYQFVAKNTLKQDSEATKHLHKISSRTNRSNVCSGQLAWPEGDQFLQELSLAKTIRVAYAVEQCVAALCKKDPEWTLKIRKGTTLLDISDWLPHMLALNHPAGCDLDPATFFRVQGELSVPVSIFLRSYSTKRMLSWSRWDSEDKAHRVRQHTAEFINASFILSYTTLQRFRTAREQKELMHVILSFQHPSDRIKMEEESISARSDAEEVIRQARINLADRVPGKFKRDLSLAQAMALLPFIIILMVTRFRGTIHIVAQLPMPAKIPFHTFMDIPAALYNTAETFNTCHIREMTKPTFLSGRWRGAYIDHTGSHGRQFDPIMRHMNIAARLPTEEEAAKSEAKVVIDWQSRGIDYLGYFLLWGFILEDGRVHIVKRNMLRRLVWKWSGHMTPFGIIGVCKQLNSSEVEGHFWIWKEEWC
ncbi:uncharacterized protein K460DRAFT_360501 [Cucurbitaria berberidis CBS 394.84]|uniref:F-box domain-containing protein n=1 Tax=Cucurbitaria berberidis CBS 394.84 TaxID=1168544 RepID=A0A9P4LCR2_9PLEO|nr:uncharacterized protein K460DRAFT_360501 [Cucurbitaria berberidis CBS 394.84]KAF1849637.1 hypothetical protein K460DRAFT_360501 [Cucurbitaria berberidis CBS 394.84]